MEIFIVFRIQGCLKGCDFNIASHIEKAIFRVMTEIFIYHRTHIGICQTKHEKPSDRSCDNLQSTTKRDDK